LRKKSDVSVPRKARASAELYYLSHATMHGNDSAARTVEKWPAERPIFHLGHRSCSSGLQT
jgi:hypothetical protein